MWPETQPQEHKENQWEHYVHVLGVKIEMLPPYCGTECLAQSFCPGLPKLRLQPLSGQPILSWCFGAHPLHLHGCALGLPAGLAAAAVLAWHFSGRGLALLRSAWEPWRERSRRPFTAVSSGAPEPAGAAGLGRGARAVGLATAGLAEGSRLGLGAARQSVELSEELVGDGGRVGGAEPHSPGVSRAFSHPSLSEGEGNTLLDQTWKMSTSRASCSEFLEKARAPMATEEFERILRTEREYWSASCLE
ncbi:unnamed protein product, partial [Prorocentrum cordatum]